MGKVTQGKVRARTFGARALGRAALVAACLLPICVLGGPTTAADAQPLTLASVAPDGLLIGGVLHGYDDNWDTGDRYRALAKQEFNAITATSYMGWGIWDDPDQPPNTAGLERILEWAGPNMAAHGHALLYPISNEDLGWYQDLDEGEHGQYVKQYIDAMMEASDGRIEVWDVVNEAFGDPGNEADDPVDADGLRTSYVEYDSMGTRYIDQAFRWAHEADDQARLIINDYGAEEWNTKSTRLFDYVVDMKARGVPIHGVGFQMHLWSTRGEPDWLAIRANFQRFADAGFEIYITELDVPVIETFDPSVTPTAAELERQRAFYEEVARITVEQPAVKSLFFWDFADAFSWLHPVRNDSMEPFVDEGTYTYAALYGGGANRTQPTRKPAYDGLIEGLRNAPGPTVNGQSERLGSRWEPSTSWLTRSGIPNGDDYLPGTTLELHPFDDETSDWSSLQWVLEPADYGLYRIRNEWEPSSGWLTRTGALEQGGYVPTREVELHSFEPEWSSQLWRLERVDDTAWRLVSAWSPVSGVLTRNGNGLNEPDTSVSLNPQLGGIGNAIDAQQWVLSSWRFATVGDVDCDELVDFSDVDAVLEYLVRLRQGTLLCPLSNQTAQANTRAADVDLDGSASLFDALAIVQCLSDSPCPLD